MTNPFTWRHISDLAPELNFDDDHRCLVTWKDGENPSDVGAELTKFVCIKQGDYDPFNRRIRVYWRSIEDSLSFF